LTNFDRDSLSRLAADVPEWRSKQMHAAYKVFEGLSEPTGSEEDWRYVEFTTPFDTLSPAFEAGTPLSEGPFLGAVEDGAGRVTIIDGHVVAVEASDISVSRIADLDEDPALRGAIPPDHNKLTAAHLSFATDGVFLDIPPNKIV